jgi:superfamily I DNA/RNA helicase
LDTFGNGIFCNDVNKSNVVRYTTIHSFKGLEAQSIILTDMEEFIGDRAEKLFYVAVSRATSEITVLYDKSSVGQLMTILSKDA